MYQGISILILRGHIRDSFDTQDLYNFVKNLYNIFKNLKIYIHTWNIFSNNISWRQINPNYKKLNKTTIYNYFNDLQFLIKKIIIDDDTQIKLIGNLNGNVSVSKMPLKGWKNYWYGKYNIIDYIYNLNIDKNEFVINTRFDLFSNSNVFDSKEILFFIKNNYEKSFIKNHFLKDIDNTLGIDNIYIGNVNTMYTLINKFYTELDQILLENKNIINQEKLVIIVNSQLFACKPDTQSSCCFINFS